MAKSKKFIFLISIPLIYVWHCSANELSAKQVQETREKIIQDAKQYIGCEYQSGAIGPKRFDCSGLVYTVMLETIGIQLPRSARTIYPKVKKIKTSELEKGDLVFFKTIGNDTISHVGIYLGKNEFIHSASDGSKIGVIISSLNEKYYAKCYAGAGRVVPSEKTSKSKDKNPNIEENKKNESKEEIIEEIIEDFPEEIVEEIIPDLC